MMSIAQDTRQALASMGQGSVEEIAATMGIRLGDPTYHSVGQALSSGVSRGWTERIGRGRYAWLNGSKPQAAPSELRPLIDSLGDIEFDAVGLTYVARTQDGAFICTDQHGVAWRVEITATARLI
jgi:hypothetical protein